MKKIFSTLFMLLCLSTAQAQRTDTLWYKYDDRFSANEIIPLEGIDSVVFTKTGMKRYKTSATTGNATGTTKTYPKADGQFYFGSPERYLAKSSTYGNVDFTKESSQFCFQRSAESEHFVIFWEEGLKKTTSGNITYDGYTCNVPKMLKEAENIWKVYVEELGFLTPGKSTTDKVKIEMYIVKKSWDGSDWRADGSGTDATYWSYSGTTKNSNGTKVGVFHCTPRAATARNGHTLAHEIGHTFQYLVSADLGMSHGLNYGFGDNASGGNEWWEDCANWQAYKVYPQYQYSDGEYYEGFLRCHHMNIHHEAGRYNNCFYQDYWCLLHGQNTVGRVWREANKPEDPSEAYMRIFKLNASQYADEMYQAYAHLTSLDLSNIHSNSQVKIGMEPQRLIEPTEEIRSQYLEDDTHYWVVDPKYCPENYGYNANPLKVPAAGTEVKASLKGIVGATGYRKVNTSYAGWRYGLVAYCADGQRLYSEVGKDKEGEVSLVVPEGCKNLWFVVMGAPTKYWRHPWDDNTANDEQWPYAVRFEGTDALGVNRTYGEFPEDYERKDTTVVINVNLPYSSSSYSYVTAQYDMNAISEALGLSTAQLKKIKSNDTTSNAGDIRFGALNATGTTIRFTTTTTDSSASIYGHWFNTSGSIVEWGSSSAIYANFFPADYKCNIGQKPGTLTKGKTYKIRQVIVYTDQDKKMYRAIMEVHVNVI